MTEDSEKEILKTNNEDSPEITVNYNLLIIPNI